jgi:hypothetical protein
MRALASLIRRDARSSLLAISLLSVACPGAHSDSDPATEQRPERACHEPRPEMCAQMYDPVCAQRDTGIRCVTTPCDSSEAREYSNACEACRDPKVVSYVPGPC